LKGLLKIAVPEMTIDDKQASRYELRGSRMGQKTDSYAFYSTPANCLVTSKISQNSVSDT